MINASGTSGQYSGVGGYATEGPESFTLQTQRGLVNKYLMPAGPNGGVQAAGEARPEFVPEATLRESYESVYYTGGAGTTVGPAERLDVVELQPESRMPAKMAGQSRGYTPGAGPTGGATNVFLPESMGAYGLIDKNKYDGFSHTLPTPLAQTFGSIATEGKTPRFGTKSAVENPYSSVGALNIASGQLSENRFNRDIAKPDALAAISDAGRPFAQQNLKPRAWSPDVTPLWKK
jgi:hypothetical protein